MAAPPCSEEVQEVLVPLYSLWRSLVRVQDLWYTLHFQWAMERRSSASRPPRNLRRGILSRLDAEWVQPKRCRGGRKGAGAVDALDGV